MEVEIHSTLVETPEGKRQFSRPKVHDVHVDLGGDKILKCTFVCHVLSLLYQSSTYIKFIIIVIIN